jgi:hypothetical protein
MRGFLSRVGPIPTLLVFCTWVVAVFRALPVPQGDFGLYVSVSERLLAGDRLYADVFENKDPLWHYTQSMARIVSPFGSWVLQVALLLAVSFATFAIARSVNLHFRLAIVVGFVCTPWIINGFFLGVAGPSELPGIALVLGIAALTLRSRWYLAGFLVGTLAFWKLVMLPIAILVVGVAVLVRRDWRGMWKVAGAAVVASAAVVGVLAIRGELLPYFEALRANVAYSGDVQDVQGVSAVMQHLANVMGPQAVLAVATSVVLMVVAGLVRPGMLRASGAPTRETAFYWLACLVGGLAVVAAIGLWVHHALVLAPAFVLSLVLVAAALAGGHARIRPSLGVTLVAATWLLAGVPSPLTYVRPIEYARANINLQTLEPLQTTLIKSTGPPTSYARVGQGDDNGSARGLREWDLACPRFSQSFYDSPALLEGTLRCLPSAQVILIDRDARRVDGAQGWNAYLDGVDRLVRRDYTCRDMDGARICVKGIG